MPTFAYRLHYMKQEEPVIVSIDTASHKEAMDKLREEIPKHQQGDDDFLTDIQNLEDTKRDEALFGFWSNRHTKP